MTNLRAHFDEHIAEILEDLLKMSNKVEKMLKRGCEILESIAEEQDNEEVQKERQQLSDTIIKDDTYVDIHELSIDDHCVRLIATEQPVASDLRKLISITKVTSDLERIGDIARYIAIKLKKKETLRPFRAHIPSIIAIYTMAIDMLHRATEAFISGDEQGSRTIAIEDDAIDEQYSDIQRVLIQEMKNDPDHIKNGQIMLEIVRLVELLGDRVTSICEWTIYAMHGKHTDLN